MTAMLGAACCSNTIVGLADTSSTQAARGSNTCGNAGGKVTRTAVDLPSESQRGISNSDLQDVSHM